MRRFLIIALFAATTRVAALGAFAATFVLSRMRAGWLIVIFFVVGTLGPLVGEKGDRRYVRLAFGLVPRLLFQFGEPVLEFRITQLISLRGGGQPEPRSGQQQ